MCQHVRLEVTISCAFVFTLLAIERLFSGMNKNVSFQIISICERGGTHRASVGFLSSLLCFGFGCERHYTTFGCFYPLNLHLFHFRLSYGLTEGKSQESPKGSDSGKSESELKYHKE